MSLDWYDDENIKIIIEIFMNYPDGLGKNETKRLAYDKSRMAPNTVDEKVAFLIEKGLLQVDPDDKSWRRGQSRRYFLLESIDLYREFLIKIINETIIFIIKLNKYLESSEKINPNFLSILKSTINNVYHLSHLNHVILTWNAGWLNNINLMRDILIIWFASFRDINSIIDNIVVPNVDEVNQSQREQRQNLENEIEKKFSDGVQYFDKMDEANLNFYRDPKQKLKDLYQDIEINDDKKS